MISMVFVLIMSFLKTIDLHPLNENIFVDFLQEPNITVDTGYFFAHEGYCLGLEYFFGIRILVVKNLLNGLRRVWLKHK